MGKRELKYGKIRKAVVQLNINPINIQTVVS